MARVPRLEAAYGQDRLAHAAPAGRLHVVQPDARPHRPDHLGVRRGAARRRPPSTLWNLVTELPRDAAGHRRHRVPVSWSWSPASRRPGAGSATSPGTCCTSTPTSASAWPCRTSSGPASSSCPRPAAPCSGGRRGALAAGRGPGLAGRRAACGATCGTGSGSPRWSARRDGVVVGLPDRPPPATGCGSRPGSSSPGASSAGPGWTRANPYSLSAAPGRPQPADHGAGRRRRQRRGARACGPAPGRSSRGRTAGSAPGPAPAAGSP